MYNRDRSWDKRSGADKEVASQRVPARVYPYSAGLFGGLMAGIAMIPVALAYGVMSGRDIWYPINLVAATLIRSWQSASEAQLAEFSLLGLVIGLALHLTLALGLGFLFAVVLPTLPGHPLFWALIVGPLLWFGAIYAGLPLLNPVMARLVDPVSFAVANIVYSMVLGVWVARTPQVPAERRARKEFP